MDTFKYGLHPNHHFCEQITSLNYYWFLWIQMKNPTNTSIKSIYNSIKVKKIWKKAKKISMIQYLFALQLRKVQLYPWVLKQFKDEILWRVYATTKWIALWEGCLLPSSCCMGASNLAVFIGQKESHVINLIIISHIV